MAVGFRSSSIRGSADDFATTISIPVPSGAAAGDVVVCGVGQWLGTGGDDTITPPEGFFEVDTHVSGIVKISAWWKRLTGADTDPYVFTWPTQQWGNGAAVCLTGALESGDPVAAFDADGAASATDYPSLTVAADSPGLVWTSYNEAADAAGTAPTGYTEIQAQTVGTTAYLIPGTSGGHTASGATAGSAMDLAAILVALLPEPSGTTGLLDATAPSVQATLAGTVSADGAVSASAPAPAVALSGVVTVSGGLAATAALPVAATTGGVVSTGAVDATGLLPAAVLGATVTVGGSVDAVGLVPVGAFTSGVVDAGQLDAAGLLPTAAITTAGLVTGTLAAQAPLPTASGQGGVSVTGQLDATAPLPAVALAAAGEVSRGTLTPAQRTVGTVTPTHRTVATISGGARP